MPLTSKDDGPDLRVGDYVLMAWTVDRLLPDVDVAIVSRLGGDGQSALSPQPTARRIGVRLSALQAPAAGAVAEGEPSLMLWRVGQVYPSSGTVAVQASGVGGSLEAPTTVTVDAVAWAAELVRVAPADVPALAAESAAFVHPLGPAPTASADMLPYVFQPAPGLGPVDPPVLTMLTPTTAVVGSPSFTLHVHGTGFAPDAVIVFNGYDEPTTVVSPTEVTTGVDMSVWTAPSLPLPVTVRSGGLVSNSLPFTFTEAELEARTARAPEARTAPKKK